jgi:VIT1/CCC1 family predicted Fe2+/Mn2+ transporter
MNEDATDRQVIDESQAGQIASKLNWLRAGVMGANDGIVSTAGMVVGVAGAAVSNAALLAAGVAAVVAGATSMAVGEYMSVSSQRDSQRAELEKERAQLAANPAYGLKQLTGLIAAQGIDRDLAHQVAVQLTEKDALTAHARYELGIDPDELISPWHAAWASMVAFVAGAVIPLTVILFVPRAIAVPVTAAATVAALTTTGSVSAHLGGAPKLRAVLRIVTGGLAAMTLAYGAGLVVAA